MSDLISERPHSFAIVGAGAVGSALGHALARAGYNIGAIVSRRASSAQRLAQQLHAKAVARPAVLQGSIDFIFVCVPDDAIAAVAEELRAAPLDWSRVVVCHTSGLLTSDEIEPLTRAGALPLSFHPVQTFTGSAPPGVFEGITVTLEGSERALSQGMEIVRAIGASPLVVTKEQKRAIHVCATIASNYLVVLFAIAAEIAGDAGISGPDAGQILRPLVEATCKNVSLMPPDMALTGPVSRGDVKTVRQHLERLEIGRPQFQEIYRILALEALRIAEKGGRIDPRSSESMREILSTGLGT